jgi:protein-L-isoaspartate(D-aspartate) O-methyltransferase
MSGYQYLAGVAAAALGTMSPNGPAPSALSASPTWRRRLGATLASQGIRNLEVVVGDGTAGFPQRAPFHAIVVSAAFTSVPEPLVAQLLDGGRLVQPMGPGGRDEVTLFERCGGAIERRAMIRRAS